MEIPHRCPTYPVLLKDLGLTPRSIEIVTDTWWRPVDLEHVTEAELQNRGLTPVQARRLRAAVGMALFYRHYHHADQHELPQVTAEGWRDVATWTRSAVGWPEQEIFGVLLLDARRRLLATKMVAMGDVGCVVLAPRIVFKDAVRALASSVIIVHNHPAGSAEPSDADILLTHRMVHVGRILAIPVLDHIVLGRGGEACSLVARGIIKADPL